ncbi:MAG: hypothetical protein HGA87_03895 [Desulfobulbaceae bacterium]|nr:hypothetical protein [Desulfobulbaceae bacterium]
MPNVPAITPEKVYRKLVDDISRLYEEARDSWGRFAWETGRRIVEVEQDGALRARYGSRLISELSRTLTLKYGGGFSPTNLSEMRRFYLARKIFQPAEKLPWTSQMELMRVKDKNKQKLLLKRAEREGLSKYELRPLIRAANREAGEPAATLPPLTRPTDWRLGTYRKAEAEGAGPASGVIFLDLGFFFTLAVTKKDAASVTITDTPAFTYAADVVRVIDGDTVYANVRLGFGASCKEKLRLRGINTPELGTPEGDKAKKYVEKLLPAGSLIVFRSKKSTDPYGRFVADVLFGGRTPGAILEKGEYLNQHLLDKGLAERMAE